MRGTQHQFECRGSRFTGQHAVKDASGVPAVLGPVGGIDFVLDVLVGVDECDVLLNATGPNTSLVCLQGAPEPMTIAPRDGSNVDVVTMTDGPHGHWFPEGAVAPHAI